MKQIFFSAIMTVIALQSFAKGGDVGSASLTNESKTIAIVSYICDNGNNSCRYFDQDKVERAQLDWVTDPGHRVKGGKLVVTDDSANIIADMKLSGGTDVSSIKNVFGLPSENCPTLVTIDSRGALIKAQNKCATPGSHTITISSKRDTRILFMGDGYQVKIGYRYSKYGYVFKATQNLQYYISKSSKQCPVNVTYDGSTGIISSFKSACF